jgi:hypothetical protein
MFDDRLNLLASDHQRAEQIVGEAGTAENIFDRERALRHV